MIRFMFHFLNMPQRCWIMMECMKAVAVSHGMREAFSTGSHAQYPPQPSSTYAHLAPSRMPALRKNQETTVQIRIPVIQSESERPASKAARAKA